MSDELPFEAVELFRAARAGLSPSAEDLARGRRRLAAALAGGATLGAATSVAAAKTAGAMTTAAVATAVAGTVAAGGATWWYASRSAAPTVPVPALAIPAHAFDAMPAPTEPPQVVVHEEAPVPAPVRVVVPGAVADPKVVVPALPAPPPPPPSPSDELARELELVRTADAALRAGDANQALAIARSPNVEQLAAELAAIEIDALCKLGQRDDARDRAAAFFDKFPYSALADRVRRSCAGGVR